MNRYLLLGFIGSFLPINDKKQGIDVITGSPFVNTGLYIESLKDPLENDDACTCVCPDGSCDPIYTGWLCGAGCP